MLERTFVHLKDIGPADEADLWSRGFKSWSDVIARGGADARARRLIGPARESQRRLARKDAAFFHAALPPSERWRMYPDFLDRTAFLDIETTGLSPDHAVVTMVGILDREGFTAYVRGENLDELPGLLRRYRLFVTFNGASFDLPFLERAFPTHRGRLFAHAAHLDLRYPLRRLGYTGGLKKIERATGNGRPSSLAWLGGADAVTLWNLACEGEPGAMATLIRYNAEDVATLPGLARLAVTELAAELPLPAPKVPGFPALDRASLAYDRALVRYLTAARM